MAHAMNKITRPNIGAKVMHQDRLGEVRATYPDGGGYSVVGRYHGAESNELGQGHFVCPVVDLELVIT